MKVRFGTAPPKPSQRSVEERLADLYEAILVAVERQHRLNLRAYPKEGPPARWVEPVPPERDRFEAHVSLLCFLEGVIEAWIRLRHGHLWALRVIHATCTSLRTNVETCIDMRTPNPSGFTSVPEDVIAAAVALKDLFQHAPVALFQPIDEDAIRFDGARLPERTFERVMRLYDTIGRSAFGTRRAWAERGRSRELRHAHAHGVPEPGPPEPPAPATAGGGEPDAT